jgi:hypothetical protein
VSVESSFAVQAAPAGPACEQEPSFASAAMLNKAGQVLNLSATAPPALLAMPLQQQQQQQGIGDLSSFSGFAQLQQQTAATGAAGTAAAAGGAADSSISSGISSPFGKGLQGQQQQHVFSSGASDAGLSAISSSTFPGSNSAVAGTPANSIIVSEYLASGSVRGLGFSNSYGKTPAPASPGVSSSSLQAPEQRSTFFASMDGTASRVQLNSSREQLAEESVLQWLPASNSLPLAAPSGGAAAAGASSNAGGGSAGRGAGAAAGSSSAGASRLVQRALYSSSEGDKHR